MANDTFNFVYLSELLDLPVLTLGNGKKVGTIADFAATTSHVYPRITGLIVDRKHRLGTVYVPWANAQITAFKKNITIDTGSDATFGTTAPNEHEILVKKTFLDKQIISTSGYKLVRVNDLQLLVDNSSKVNPNLWLVHIDIGMKGLFRRLGVATQVNAFFRWLVGRDIRDKFVPWKYVQPTSTTSVYGSLRLSSDSSKLSEIHPADLADIMEDLGLDERHSLMESLEPSIAAATVQELPMAIRVQLAEGLDIESLAAIVNEMPTDETVDLLDEISPEKRNALYVALTADKVAEIRDLSKLSKYAVGSIMNTDFVSAKVTQTVKDILKIVKSESRKAELVYYVYIVDDEEHLKGMVTLRQLMLSKQKAQIAEIMIENVISVRVDSNIKRVAQLFFKYNFEALPVVDADNRLQGFVTLRDTLENVFPEMKEASAG